MTDKTANTEVRYENDTDALGIYSSHPNYSLKKFLMIINKSKAYYFQLEKQSLKEIKTEALQNYILQDDIEYSTKKKKSRKVFYSKGFSFWNHEGV